MEVIFTFLWDVTEIWISTWFLTSIQFPIQDVKSLLSRDFTGKYDNAASRGEGTEFVAVRVHCNTLSGSMKINHAEPFVFHRRSVLLPLMHT